MIKKEFSTEFAGKKLIAEFNDLTENADGSVLLKYGETVILATCVMSKEAEKNIDFFPLTVDYEEKYYAVGKILGSRYTRREGKPSDEAILAARIIDRTIRPLFDQWIRHEIQIVITVLSVDEDDPQILGVIAASLALGASKIPFNGPVSAARISKQKKEDLQINSRYVERENEIYGVDLIACGKDGHINMIECGGNEVQEEIVIEALQLASKEIEKLNAWQKEIGKEIGKKKMEIPELETPETIKKLFEEKIAGIFKSSIMSGTSGNAKIDEITDLWMKIAKEKISGEDFVHARNYLEKKIDSLIHEQALKENKRADGRALDELRPLSAQAGGISSILHGSGIFYRGGTHILSVLTLGGLKDAQTMEGIENKKPLKKFMHQYNFPPFSVGETGRMGTDRRMIGHGALAEKALFPMIPKTENFPYTIRIVSEALSSNGSTSMGSVCASTIALMDGGVPMKKPVAGIASGLMSDNSGNYKILTDIAGPEDHFGDMDFKVAGTKDGITAIQMDVKVSGIAIPILAEAFGKAKQARLKILETIYSAIEKPREKISVHAPQIIAMKIPVEKIGEIIGPGGKYIKNVQEKTGVEINIENDGIIYITGENNSTEKAKLIIEGMI